MSKWYGNVNNRLEEGKNYTGREIKVGDDVTMYLYSDRHCYYVSEVIDQKHIKVKPYFVCADKSKADGMGHQEWLYFKSYRDFRDYLKYEGEITDEDCAEREAEETWAFRYGKWMDEVTYTKESNFYNTRGFFCHEITDREQKSLEKNGYYKRYFDLSGNVSFGVRDYYYDWEF